jgi:hypothetical protein
VVAAPLLALGTWVNPAIIIVGLFIHSYVAAATATEEKQHGAETTEIPVVHTLDTSTSPLYTLFGIPNFGKQGEELLFYGILKVAVFLIVLGWAFYLLATHH